MNYDVEQLKYYYMDFYSKEVKKQIGAPFWPIALWFRIKINEQDLNYIVNIIKKDKCFPLLLYSQINAQSHLERAYMHINEIVFYDKFYNDSLCPRGVKLILFILLGLAKDYLDEGFPNLLAMRYEYAKRWFEMVT